MQKKYTTIELFAGAGGLALGLELTKRFKHMLLNERDKHACATLKKNKPEWNVVHASIEEVDFSEYYGKIDLITGGFPCQAFSYAGKKEGFDDPRGNLFFEYMNVVRVVQPKVFLIENVKGLASHDKGRTLSVMKDAIKASGYKLYEPSEVLNSLNYEVPEKRERIILVAYRNDLTPEKEFSYPKPLEKKYNLRDAFYKGDLFDKDVPDSKGIAYSEKRFKILDQVPAGGNWKSLPLEVQKEYLGKSFYSGGGKTGIARRLSWEEPCLTILCSPSQKQTERCHPDETRPLTIRESARVQTFPDEWEFEGSVTAQYTQIGNAVPVNLAKHLGDSVADFLDGIK